MNRNEATKYFLNEVTSREDEFKKHIVAKVHKDYEVEDILQESYKRMWEYLFKPEFDKKIGVPAHGIIKNCIFEHWRSVAKQNKTVSNISETDDGEIDLYEMTESPDDILEGIIKDFESGLAYEVLLQLGDADRTLIHMRYIEEMSYKEMAEILEMNDKTLSSKLCRAVKRFRNMYFDAEAGK